MSKAKGKGKQKKTAKTKDEEEKMEVHDEEKEEPQEYALKDKDIRTISITLEYYENIVSLFPNADIQTKCRYVDRLVGESGLTPVTDSPKLPIGEIFTFKINASSKKDMDYLISSPILLTVVQCMGTLDPTIYEQLLKTEDIKNSASVKSFDSIVSMYEAFTGETLDVVAKVNKSKSKKKIEKKKEKKSKEKSSKSTKSKSTKSSNSKKAKLKKLKIITDSFTNVIPPMIYGMCALDLLPLFYGRTSISETLTINPTEIFNDERMGSYKVRPQITVSVQIDKELCFEDPVILNVTLESVYNIPSLMRPGMDYKICCNIPLETPPQEPMLFANSIYTSNTHQEAMKCWPGIKKMGHNANTTRYRVSEDNILNSAKIPDLEQSIKEPNPRLQFNVLKRSLLLKEGMEAFCHQVQNYRKILIEIFMSIKERTGPNMRSSALTILSVGKDSKLSSHSSMRCSVDFKSKSNEMSKRKSVTYLHLMSIVDVTSLLYPGVTKTRVASPLTTFSFEEAFQLTGVTDSYFSPKPIIMSLPVPEPRKVEPSPSADSKPDKSKKKDKSSGSKSSKGSKKGKGGGNDTEKGDLKQFLPPKPVPPPEPEPSTVIFSDDGKHCFLIMEIELSKPIFEKQNIEDLTQRLDEILEAQTKDSSKIILTHKLTKDYYREVLNQITKDIYTKYKQYLLMREQQSTVAERDFIKYLETTGAYQSYMTSIKGAISILTVNKFRFDEVDQKGKQYQNFIGEVFVYLVSEMNDTLNRLICSGLEPAVVPKPKPLDKLLLYAKEAAALGRTELAERYFLERICYDESGDPNCWFDYAVYNLETKRYGRAFECMLDALSRKQTHKYSLLLFGILLDGKGQRDEAETCFLNLLVSESRWVEGWAILFLFYEKYNKYEGMDMTMDMIKKYKDDERVSYDYFDGSEDLIWTHKVCPKTTFFRTAALMLKMKLYEWVELALAQELGENFGFAQYLLSAVCLYQGYYVQALEHIQQAKAYLGPSYALSSLSGHCRFALNRPLEAKEDYYNVLKATDRPDDIHMVYINCARILENLGDHQEARKLILLACKYSPTHYTWFRAGELYLKENDLLSAEECFSEANFKDNRCPEYWGHLTLINLQLNRLNEAELCYSQAIKNSLEGPLLENIKKEFKKFNAKSVQT